MTDVEIKANLYLLEQRMHQLEEKIKHMADVDEMETIIEADKN